MIFCLLAIIGWIIGGALWGVYRAFRPVANIAPVAVLCCLFFVFVVENGMLG